MVIFADYKNREIQKYCLAIIEKLFFISLLLKFNISTKIKNNQIVFCTFDIYCQYYIFHS